MFANIVLGQVLQTRVEIKHELTIIIRNFQARHLIILFYVVSEA